LWQKEGDQKKALASKLGGRGQDIGCKGRKGQRLLKGGKVDQVSNLQRCFTERGLQKDGA